MTGKFPFWIKILVFSFLVLTLGYLSVFVHEGTHALLNAGNVNYIAVRTPIGILLNSPDCFVLGSTRDFCDKIFSGNHTDAAGLMHPDHLPANSDEIIPSFAGFLFLFLGVFSLVRLFWGHLEISVRDSIKLFGFLSVGVFFSIPVSDFLFFPYQIGLIMSLMASAFFIPVIS